MHAILAKAASSISSVFRPARVSNKSSAASLSSLESDSDAEVPHQTSKHRSLLFATLTLLLQSAYFLSGLIISALHLDPFRAYYLVSSLLLLITFWGLHLTREWSARKTAGQNLPYVLWAIFAMFNFCAFALWAGLMMSAVRGEQQAFDTGFIVIASAFLGINTCVYVLIVVRLCICYPAEDETQTQTRECPGAYGQTEKR